MNILIWIVVNIFAINLAIGSIFSIIAASKSGKDEFHDKEVGILFKIIFMWSWKYKSLSKELKDAYR